MYENKTLDKSENKRRSELDQQERQQDSIQRKPAAQSFAGQSISGYPQAIIYPNTAVTCPEQWHRLPRPVMQEINYGR